MPRLCFHPRSLLLALALLALASTRPAEANLMLLFDQPSSTIGAVGGTTTLGLYVAQIPGTGPAITASNPLLTGGIQLTFATTGAAVETNFTANPVWDNSSTGTATSGSSTIFSLTTVSLAGISSLAQPLLLGSFTFTGRSVGTTTVTAATISPGVNFIDLNGDTLDPTNTPTASIVVGPAVSVPEPTSLALLVIAGVAAASIRQVARRRTAA